MPKLNQLKSYATAVAAQRKKQFTVAILNYTLTLKLLVEADPKNRLDRAVLHIQLAKCYGQLALKKIFADPTTLLPALTELDQFHAELNKAQALVTSLSSSTEVRKDKLIKQGIAATKTFLLKKLTDPTSLTIIAVKARILEKNNSADFNLHTQKELAFLDRFYRHYLQNLGAEYELYLVNALTALSQLAIEQGGKTTGEQAINWYKNALPLLDQALPLTGKRAFVRPAELYFDKWYTLEQIAILSRDREATIAAYQQLILEFNTAFASLLDTDKDYYHYRPTQYAYAAFYAQKAHSALAALADTAAARKNHEQSAQTLQQQFAHLAEEIIPTELPQIHATNMLFALASLTSLQHARPHGSAKLADGMDDEEEDNDSEYEADKTTQTKNEQKSTTLPAPATSKPSTLAQKRTFSMQQAESSESSSDSDSDSDDEELLIDCARKKPATPNKPASKQSSAGARLSLSLTRTTTTTRLYTHNQSHSASLFKFSPLSSSRSWYTDAQVLSALDRRLRAEIDRNEVLVFGGIELSQVLPQIIARRAEQLARQARGETVATKFSIAVNLGRNHWAALALNFSHGLNNTPIVHYADPLTTTAPASLQRQLSQALRVAFIRTPITIYQQDGYNCGPWVVTLLETLAKTGHLPLRASVNIAQQRAADSRHFQEPREPSSGSASAKKQKMT